MGLYQKLLAVMKDCYYIQKDKESAGGEGYGYRYASEAVIKAKVGAALSKHGVLFLPTESKFIGSWKGTTKKGVEFTVTNIEFGFKFVDAETGESHSGTMVGSGTDNADKGTYKAVTGAIKYILTGAFLIETGDDPEATPEEDKPTKEEKKQESTNAKAAAQSVATAKIAAVPEKQVMMSRAELSGWLPRATRAMINNALADVANRLDARYGTGYATALRSEALGVFRAAKSSELSDDNAKLVLLQLYDDLQKPDDPKAKGESPDNELQEYLDGMTDVGSTVFAFKLLSDRLAKAIGSDAARNDYHAILEKQGVKHSNEFKGKGMDAKAKAALTELYHLVVKEEGVPA